MGTGGVWFTHFFRKIIIVNQSKIAYISPMKQIMNMRKIGWIPKQSGKKAGHVGKILSFFFPFFLVPGFFLLRYSHPLLYDSLTSEDCLVEHLIVLIYLASACFSFLCFLKLKKTGIVPAKWIYFLLFLGCLFVAMEEIDWGQRLLHFPTIPLFQRFNTHGKMNLHNMQFLTIVFELFFSLMGFYGVFSGLVFKLKKEKTHPAAAKLLVTRWWLVPWFLPTVLVSVLMLLVCIFPEFGEMIRVNDVYFGYQFLLVHADYTHFTTASGILLFTFSNYRMLRKTIILDAESFHRAFRWLLLITSLVFAGMLILTFAFGTEISIFMNRTIGKAYQQKKMHEKALQHYLDIAAAQQMTGKKKEETFMDIGRIYQKIGNINMAYLYFQRAGNLAENPWDAYLGMGRVLLGAGQGEKAVEMLESADLLHPGNKDVQMALAMAYLETGNREKALSVLESWRDRHPEDAFPLAYQLGKIYAEKGQTRKSLFWLQQAVGIRPKGIADIMNDPVFAPIQPAFKKEEWFQKSRESSSGREGQ